MLYSLHCNLSGPCAAYLRDLIQQVAGRFSLDFVLKQGLTPHVTLKYPFTTRNIARVEKTLDRFARETGPTPFRVGGINGFPPDVVFCNVDFSPEARRGFNELVKRLRALDLEPWSQYDDPNLRFHTTVAARCGEHYLSVITFLKRQEKFFSCSFDHLTLLRCPDGQQNTNAWRVQSRFPFAAPPPEKRRPE